MIKNVNILQLTFENKVVVITGAAHGIGRAICKEFAIRGASVVGIDILENELFETKNEVEMAIENTKKYLGSIQVYVGDVTCPNKVQSIIEKIIVDLGKIDILINVAGGVAGQVHKAVDKVTNDEWKNIIAINLDAVFYMTRAIVPYMKRNKYGRIVNISSGAGRSSSLTGIQAYTSAKAGQIGFTRQLAKELGKFGITANNIAPGFVLSNPSTQRQWESMTKLEQTNLIESISLKRLGKPEDIAYSVLFFASDFAKYVTGQVISVDGGLQLF